MRKLGLRLRIVILVLGSAVAVDRVGYAQSVLSVNFASFPAGTPAGALSGPDIVFTVNPGASAQVDDRPGVGRSLVYSQQAEIGGLPRSSYLIEPAGLEIQFRNRMSRISFDWAVKGRTVPAGPGCVVDQVSLVMDSLQAVDVQAFGGYVGTPCPPPGVAGWSGNYYTGHFDSDTGFRNQRAFRVAGLVFPFTTAAGLAQTDLLIFNLEVITAPPCVLGVPEITSHSANPPPFGDTTITAGSPILLTWNPSSGLNLNDGSYVVVTQRTYGGAAELVKGTVNTFLSVPVAASETDYTLYVSVRAFEFCYPNIGYVYGGWSTRRFTVRGVVPRPAIKRVPPRPPVRRLAS